MNDLLREILATLGDARLLHAATVHLPIAGATVGVPLALWLALFRRDSRAWTRGAALYFLGVATTAWVAATSGEDARTLLGAATTEARDAVERHLELARWVRWATPLPALLLGATLLPLRRARARRVLLGAGVLAALGCAALVSATGHLGGLAVYRHGAGVQRDESVGAPELSATLDPRVRHFEERVRPLLERSCAGCHGPGEHASSGLDVTSTPAVLRGGRRGPAVVPGAPDASLLLQAVSWTHATLRMPLGGDRLSDEALADLRRWIADGAVGGTIRAPGTTP